MNNVSAVGFTKKNSRVAYYTYTNYYNKIIVIMLLLV